MHLEQPRSEMSDARQKPSEAGEEDHAERNEERSMHLKGRFTPRELSMPPATAIDHPRLSASPAHACIVGALESKEEKSRLQPKPRTPRGRLGRKAVSYAAQAMTKLRINVIHR